MSSLTHVPAVASCYFHCLDERFHSNRVQHICNQGGGTMRDANPNARNRRSFLRDSLATGGAIAGATVLGSPKLFAQTSPSPQSSIFASSERLTTGDVAILK